MNPMSGQTMDVLFISLKKNKEELLHGTVSRKTANAQLIIYQFSISTQKKIISLEKHQE